MDMFAPREVTQAQILSKEFYYKRVSEVQTRIYKLERPFLFYFETKASDYSDQRSFYIGCYDLITKSFTRLACGKYVLGCIQVLSSLYTYDKTGMWSSYQADIMYDYEQS